MKKTSMPLFLVTGMLLFLLTGGAWAYIFQITSNEINLIQKWNVVRLLIHHTGG